jgi:hypothetical protein
MFEIGEDQVQQIVKKLAEIGKESFKHGRVLLQLARLLPTVAGADGRSCRLKSEHLRPPHSLVLVILRSKGVCAKNKLP